MLNSSHRIGLALSLTLFAFVWPGMLKAQESKPNVLFIAIDDLNDWVSLFGGHSAAKTPHFDQFAREGAIVFQNAHCAGPICGPSRSAMLSGFMPSRSGIYGNSQNMLESKLVQQYATLPEYFSKHGYLTISMGKISHKHNVAGGIDAGQWMYDVYEPTKGRGGVDRKKYTSRNANIINGKPGPESKYTRRGGSEFAWGPTSGGKEETPTANVLPNPGGIRRRDVLAQTKAWIYLNRGRIRQRKR